MNDTAQKSTQEEIISEQTSDSCASESKENVGIVPKGFEEFDLDDIEVIESKVFA